MTTRKALEIKGFRGPFLFPGDQSRIQKFDQNPVFEVQFRRFPVQNYNFLYDGIDERFQGSFVDSPNYFFVIHVPTRKQFFRDHQIGSLFKKGIIIRGAFFLIRFDQLSKPAVHLVQLV